MSTVNGTWSGGADAWKERVERGNWESIRQEINEYGGALLPQLLTVEECEAFRAMYPRDELFRSTIDMGRYRFGEGQYRYFKAPYPEPIEGLKQALYPRLLPIARDWWSKLERHQPWPATLDAWLEMCHAAGQTRPTPLILRYGAGDWNALHRDLYGELVFPLQVVINLSHPGVDHTGGEFLLLEQRPRAQSRGTATTIPHGHGYCFTTRDRPVASARGWSRHLSATAFPPFAPASASPWRWSFTMPRKGEASEQTYTLLGAGGKFYPSDTPGAFGGHRRSKIYGSLDCPSALRAIARGGYVKHRVFFADEATAIAAGYRPCAICCPDRYRDYKATITSGHSSRKDAIVSISPRDDT